MGSVGGEIQGHVICADDVHAEFKLKSAVAENSRVLGEGRIARTSESRIVGAVESVRGHVVVEVNRTADPMVQHAEIKTEVELLVLLPGELVVHEGTA